VQERFSDAGKGKGFALEWMFHRLFAMDKKYDAVCIFDADNLVHPNFLKEMNSRLCQGEKSFKAIWIPRILKIAGFQPCSPFPSGLPTTFGIWLNITLVCPAF
jgi:hypothetical protein